MELCDLWKPGRFHAGFCILPCLYTSSTKSWDFNKVTKFTNDYLPMTMHYTKDSHKEMKKNVTTQKSLKTLTQREF